MKNIITTVVMTVALTGLTGTVFADGADEQLITKDAQTITNPISEDEADKNKDETSSKDDTQVYKSDESDKNTKTNWGYTGQ